MQGHSRSWDQGLYDDAIHSKYTAATAEAGPLLFHYTSDKRLFAILENGQIEPGGRTTSRAHVFMSRHRVSDTGVIPDSFKKRGANIGIELDGAKMLRDQIPLCLSNANVVLCPRPIWTTYIIAAKYISEPRHTLYKKPSEQALRQATEERCVCAYCGRQHVFGTQWCLGSCWVPITSEAVQDHIAFIPVPAARADELKRLYGLTTRSLQQLIDSDEGSSVNPLTLTMHGTVREHTYAAAPKRQRTVSPSHAAAAAAAVVPPTAEAGAGQPTIRRRPAAVAPKAPTRYPTYGRAALRGASAHLKKSEIHKYNHGAQKRRDVNGEMYLNHSDRYHRDARYRDDCQRHNPPTPEDLYYEDGDYVM